jgi:glycosyltransferase EpsF
MKSRCERGGSCLSDNVKPARVLHVLRGMDRGGAETMIMNYYRNIDRNRIQFDFLCMSDEEHHYDEEIESLGGRIIHIPPPKKSGVLAHIRDMVSAMKGYGPFVAVHAHTLHHSGIVLLSARVAGIKNRISHSHSTSNVGEDRLIRKVYFSLMRLLIHKQATRLLACGEEAGRYLFDDRKYEEGRVTVLPLAIDLELYRDLSIDDSMRKRHALSLENTSLVLGHVGRFAQPKNHMFFIPLLKQLRDLGVDCKLVLVGDGSLREEFEEEIANNELENYVKLLGVRSDIPELMNMLDVFLLPSLYEGLPVVSIEAQAAGVPCIMSDNITREVDMGLGLVNFMSLDSPIQDWTKLIVSLQGVKRPDYSLRREALRSRGYSIHDNVDMLYEIYGV